MQVMTGEQFGMLSQFLPLPHGELSFLSKLPEQTQGGLYRVLIMERSVSLAKLLATGLSAESVPVDVTYELDAAMALLESRSYELVVLDLDTPDADGAAWLERLRANHPLLSVLALSSRSGVEDLVTALDHGADDYLFKPFSLLELMARVRALRRRAKQPVAVKASASKLQLFPDQCRVERDGRNIDLTPREFALLEYLVQNAGKTLSRALLTQEVWNMPADTNTNIVDVYIKYLRDKIDGDQDEKLIRTVRGMGYLIQLQK